MKHCIKILVTLLIMFSGIACSGLSGRKMAAPAQPPTVEKTQSYTKMINTLSAKLVKRLQEINNKSFYICPKDIKNINGFSNRFAGDIELALSERQLKIKRKNLVSWGRATMQSDKVSCEEILEVLASDYYIEFNFQNCIDDSQSCLEVIVKVIENGKNHALLALKEDFKKTATISSLYSKRVMTEPTDGSRKKPYKDIYTAANYLTGRLSCLVKKITHNDDVSLVIEKTKKTNPDLTLAFSQAAADYGLDQIAELNTIRPVVSKIGDTFESGVYNKLTRRKKLATANTLLALDLKSITDNIVYITAQAIPLEELEIFPDGKTGEILQAGEVIPGCTASGYVFGKNLNAITLANTSANDTAPSNIKKKKRPFRYNFKPQINKNSRAYKDGQKVMIKKIESAIKERLKKDNIHPGFTSLIALKGEVGLPAYHQDDNTLDAIKTADYYYCDIIYNLYLTIGKSRIIHFNRTVSGMGRSKKSALRDTLLGISDIFYPVTSTIGLAVSREITIADIASLIKTTESISPNGKLYKENLSKALARFIETGISHVETIAKP